MQRNDREKSSKGEKQGCGYRMLSNLNKIVKGQEIRNEKDKERNRLYYYLEIAQTLKDNQIKRSQNRKRKRGEEGRGEEELEQEKDRGEYKQQEKRRGKSNNIEGKRQKKDPHYTPGPPICTKTTLRLGRGIASGGLPA